MKVLMVSKALVVGAYQRKLEELAAMPEMELMVVVPPFWQEEVRRIELERLHTTGYRLEVEPARFNGRFHLFHFPGLGRRMREFRPDIVHVDEEPYNLATVHALWLARRVGACSLFFTWQNLLRRYPPPFRWMEDYAFRASDRAIAGNAEAVEVLRSKGFRKPVDVIPQFGVDPAVFAPDSSSCRPERMPAFNIGFVGRLVEQKGILDLLEAAAGLDGDWRVTLVGNGPLRRTVEERGARADMAGRVKVIPGVPSREMPAILNGMDMLVLPSLTRPNWKEQFGRALVEAMACRVPVVGSDSGEIPNVIGDAGLVFPEGDVSALRGHLAALRGSATLRAEIGERGRARVLARFTQARVAQETYQAYRAVLGRLPEAAPRPL